MYDSNCIHCCKQVTPTQTPFDNNDKGEDLEEDDIEEDNDLQENDDDEAEEESPKPCKPCEHDGEGIHSFVEYDGFYVTPTWLAGKKNFPTHCAGCNKEIVAGTKKYLKDHQGIDYDPDKHYRVSGQVFSIFLCHNAQKEFHKCTYALCKPCKLEACKKRKATDDPACEANRRGTSRRSRKVVDLCLPGETIDPATGFMVASV